MIGIEINNFPGNNFASLDNLYTEASEKAGFQFAVIPLMRSDFKTGDPMNAFDADHLSVPDATYNSFVIAKTSDWLPVATEKERLYRDQILKREISWVSHIGLRAILITVKDFTQPQQFAHFISGVLAGLSYTQVWLRIPLRQDSVLDSWEYWNTIFTACHHSSRLYCALEFNIDCPAIENWRRWRGEPVAALICPSQVWLRNSSGFPVLGKNHQTIVRSFAKYFPELRVIYRGENGLIHEKGPDTFVRYIQHLMETRDPNNVIDENSQGYEDRLQIPLQPLSHNLESITYQVFLLDPVKYQLYEDAIFAALQDRIHLDQKLGIQSIDVENWRCVVMVVGAGSHGPLVDCVLRACVRANCSEKVKIYALEKNPNAMVTLKKQNTVNALWKNHTGPDGDGVSVIHADMRGQSISEKADILVSELLGSFGDNELSPECLDGAQKLLKKEDVFRRPVACIPTSYTAFVAPITSVKLKQNVRALQKNEHDDTVFDMPYVVKFHQVNDELATSQPIWIFEHPVDNIIHDNSHNSRESFLQFSDFKTDGSVASVHGLAGYFECILYEPLPDENGNAKDAILMSINPSSHSPHMFSWFPMFFPLQENMTIGPDDVLDVCMRRCCESREHKVWYEWSAAVRPKSALLPRQQTRIHNRNGSVFWISL